MKIKLDEGAFMPTRAHDTDAGLDLYARVDKVIPAFGQAVFDTGVHIELPMHEYIAWDTDIDFYGEEHDILKKRKVPTVGFIKSKSGMMVKHGITSDGTIDYGYTGSIRVVLFNNFPVDYHVKRGDKISQLVIVPALTQTIEVVDALEDTERGDNGFGSTGR